MRHLKLTLAYDGTDFSGWQRQRGMRTVQGTLELAWRQVTGEDVDTTASGRTDAGVHALGQVAGLATATRLDNATLLRAVNASLPEDVVVRSVETAPDGFDATADALAKRYRYVIHCGPMPDPFRRSYAWHIRRPLDVDVMHEAAQALVGTHDFASFQAAGSPRESTVRTIFELSVQGRAGEWAQEVTLEVEPDRKPDVLATAGKYGQDVTIEVEGDGFLYKMVRTIVGTVVRVGHGQAQQSWIQDVLAARNRAAAGQTAPPHGLFLVSVRYA